jgi:KUP system potassium uptake protein
MIALSIGALGVVYGDLGTSPLYTINECFALANNLEVSEVNVFGILSLIFWSLTIVVILKYMFFVMRADNNGEGGMMALISLIQSKDKESRLKKIGFLVLLGICGTCLQLADSVLTPSITVLSAIEGLEVGTKAFHPYIVPVTIGILVALFYFQKRGTGGIGAVFGPLMIIWFLMIGGAGLTKVIVSPMIFKALNPYYAVNFFIHNRLSGFFLLGSVVLCFTGGEALYADMGHFGKKPIKYAWLFLAYPCLILNYFGQGVNLLTKGRAALPNVFFSLAEGWMLYPMIVIATIAAIIASQALISGAFSLTQQAMQLGFVPRLNIVHTSYDMHGQIYIPEINYLLMFGCLTLVLLFQSSASLAAAYGMAVMGTMTITSILLCTVAVKKWNWKPWHALCLTGLFLCFDIPYLIANLAKLFHGAWIPLAIASVIIVIMLTWIKGRRILSTTVMNNFMSIDLFMANIETTKNELVRVKGTAVFMTSNSDIVPMTLLHHFKHNKTLHERVILLSVITQNIPIVPKKEKIKIEYLENGFYQIITYYGYMEKPDIPLILQECNKIEQNVTGYINIDVDNVSYYLGKETLLTTGHSKMVNWQKNLFSYLSKNAVSASSFFKIPADRVIELGIQIEI